MLLAHKIELRPTPEQMAHFSKPENKWSKNEAYQHYINVLRKEFDWYNEVSSRVKAKQKAGFPRFKKKDLRDSFALRESAKFDVHGRELRIEKLKTKIELRQPLRFQGTAKQVTISKRAGKYFASILIETEDYNPHGVDHQHSVGVDFGIKFITCRSNFYL